MIVLCLGILVPISVFELTQTRVSLPNGTYVAATFRDQPNVFVFDLKGKVVGKLMDLGMLFFVCDVSVSTQIKDQLSED